LGFAVVKFHAAKGFIHVSKRMERASHFFRLQAIFCLYFVFLMSSGRQV